MRIDKFLWCIRVYKTRTLAAEQVKLGKVWVNEELIKPSREIKPGDVIKVRKGPIHFSWKMLTAPTSRVGAKLVPTYAADVTSPEELARLEVFRLQMSADRPRGSGRPTKRERRDLDEFFDLENDEWFETPSA